MWLLPLIIIGSCVSSCIGQNDLCLTDCSALKKVTYWNCVVDGKSKAQWLSAALFTLVAVATATNLHLNDLRGTNQHPFTE